MTLNAMKLKLLSSDREKRPSLTALTLPLSAMADATVEIAPHLPPRDFDAGYAAGAAAERAVLADTLRALDDCKMTLTSQLADLEELYRRRCAALLAQILKAAIPPISEAAARATISRLFDETTGKAPHADVAMIAAPDIHDALRPYCEQFEPPLCMQSDAQLAPGTLQARWKSGGIDCDVGRSLFAIVEMLNSETDEPSKVKST